MTASSKMSDIRIDYAIPDVLRCRSGIAKKSDPYDVVLCKTGRALHFEGARSRAGAQSETGDTEGLLRMLVDAGYRVLLIGSVYGRVYGQAQGAVDVFWFNHTGLNHDDPSKMIKDRFEAGVQELMSMGVTKGLPWIDVSGSNVEECLPWNPSSCLVQLSGLRYSGALLYAMARLSAYRIAVIGDVRSYPRDSAMHWLSDAVKPIAVLSQRTGRVFKNKRVGPLPMNMWEVDAFVDTWWPRDIPSDRIAPSPVGRSKCVYVANCHVKSGFRQTSRAKIHEIVLGAGTPVDAIAGEGWEHYFGATADHEGFLVDLPQPGGSVIRIRAREYNSEHVRELMGCFSCAPVIGGRDWGRTTKISELASAGCVPLLYGRHDENGAAPLHMSDRDETLFSSYDLLRWETTEELIELANRCANDDEWRMHQCRRVELLTTPNTDTVLNCLKECIEATAGSDPDSHAERAIFRDRDWISNYGGYTWAKDPWVGDQNASRMSDFALEYGN